ncbi:MFS transporter [Neisseria perflava]|uniref:MFS transporter n=1 Tax=Neisseria perflava TaxID=33053 RepID=UPI00209EE052|nr:MFS transporter [Neisseria perflava]MCP1659185.1 MFS family permease [Neisseria perflava]MCP1771773.1 MFS family permease [Neisseria perflava]
MKFPILKQAGFLPFLITRLFTVFAIQIQAIVVAWHLYDLTRDPMALAYVGLAQFVPMVLCLPVAGDVADRFNRKLVLACGLWRVCAACR